MNGSQHRCAGLSRRVGARAAAPVAAAALALILALGAAGAPPASARPLARDTAAAAICVSKPHPRLAARMSAQIAAALRGRRSVVGLAVEDEGLGVSCRLDASWRFYAASVIKATIISALLRKIGGPSHLTKAQRSLAWEMITESDNNAATKLWNQTGHAALQRFLDLAKMTHTVLSTAWGLTRITAQDELTLLRLLTGPGTVLTLASRRYVLYLMAHVIAAQRWGVPAGAPAKVTVHVKNGWLPYPTGSDWRINSIGAFTGTHLGWQTAVLTTNNPSMDYGVDTIQAAARVINRDLANF
jgi:Beta-lactamase enzyme family